MICKKIVNGNWIFSIIWEMIRFLNGLLIKKISSNVMFNDRIIFIWEWLFLMWYDLLKILVKIDLVVILLVIVDEIFVISRVKVKIIVVLFFNRGLSNDFVCCSFLIWMLFLKKVVVVNRIMVLLMVYFIIIEKSVLNNLYFNIFFMDVVFCLLYLWFWIIFECRKRLWGIIIVFSIFIIMSMFFLGIVGVIYFFIVIG